MPKLADAQRAAGVALGIDRPFTDTDVRLYPQLREVAERYSREYAGTFDRVLEAQHTVRSGGELTPGAVRSVLNCMRTDPAVTMTRIDAIAYGPGVEIVSRPHLRVVRDDPEYRPSSLERMNLHWFRKGKEDPAACRKCGYPEADDGAHLQSLPCGDEEPHGGHWHKGSWGMHCPGVEDPDYVERRLSHIPARTRLRYGYARNGKVLHIVATDPIRRPVFVWHPNWDGTGFTGDPEFRVTWECGARTKDPYLLPAPDWRDDRGCRACFINSGEELAWL